MGLRKTVDLETFTARERAKDIIAKMPNLNRHDIYGGAPGYSSGGSAPNFGFTGYNPGCTDCMPECPDMSIKGCGWPHGDIYWPTVWTPALSTPVVSAELRHDFAYIENAHSNVAAGYSETVRHNTYQASSILVLPEGSFAYPGTISPEYFVPLTYVLSGEFKIPGDTALDSFRPLTEDNPWAPWGVSVQQHVWGSGDDLSDFSGSTTSAGVWHANRQRWPAIDTISTNNLDTEGTYPGDRGTGVPQGGVTNRVQLTAMLTNMDLYDFAADYPTFVGGALGGFSLRFTLRVIGAFVPPGFFEDPLPRLFAGSVRGCLPPPGTIVDDDINWTKTASGAYRAPTPVASPLAVYYDGLLAVPALHYTVVDGEIVPTTALVDGTRVTARYVADGSPEWP